MTDALDALAEQARATVRNGYYGKGPEVAPPKVRRLSRLLENAGTSRVVAEIKPASPTAGTLRADADAGALAAAFSHAGATAVSVLTEPVKFGGSLENLAAASASAKVPVLFKDFFVSRAQLEAAARGGAGAILFIHDLFERGYVDMCLESAIVAANDYDLEVVLEVYDEAGYRAALESAADIIGINNRDLRTLEVDPYRAEVLLASAEKDRPVMALSAVETVEDVRRQMAAGADAVLVGSALMRSSDPVKKLEELVAWRK